MRALRLLLFLSALPLAASDVVTKYDTVNVADGIYAFVAPDPKSGLVNGNVVAVVGDEGVLVVDTGQLPTLAKRMIAEIKAKTNQPVRYVVNTHWHWDHNLANFVYRDAFPRAAIVSTAFTRKSLIEFTPMFTNFMNNSAGKMLEQMRAMRAKATDETMRANLDDDIDDLEAGLPEVKNVPFVAPGETFEKELTVYLGKREVRIFHPGRANTAGDAMVYVPDAKVLITGDVVVTPTPYATGSYITEWISVLDNIAAMDLAAIVPGHGPVQRDKSYVASLNALLKSLNAQVQAAVKEGLSLEETQKRVNVEEFRKRFAGDDRRRNRFFKEYFLDSAIKYAWHQARGEETKESPV